MTASKWERLIEGLRSGDATTIAIVVFAVVGTIIIYAITEVIQRRRKQGK